MAFNGTEINDTRKEGMEEFEMWKENARLWREVRNSGSQINEGDCRKPKRGIKRKDLEIQTRFHPQWGFFGNGVRMV